MSGLGLVSILKNSQITSAGYNTVSESVNKSDAKAFIAVGAEALFAIFPIIVIFSVNFFDKTMLSIFYVADLSFASAVLSGQTLVKVVVGAAKYKDEMNYNFVSFISALIIVFLLGPSIITLVYITTSIQVGIRVAIFQIFLLVASLIVFVYVGGNSQFWSK